MPNTARYNLLLTNHLGGPFPAAFAATRFTVAGIFVCQRIVFTELSRRVCLSGPSTWNRLDFVFGGTYKGVKQTGCGNPFAGQLELSQASAEFWISAELRVSATC